MSPRALLNVCAAGCIGWWLILTWFFDCVWLWALAMLLILTAEAIHAVTKPVYGPREVWGPINHSYENPRRNP